MEELKNTVIKKITEQVNNNKVIDNSLITLLHIILQNEI